MGMLYFTARQWDVYKLLRKGYSYTDISQKLYITYGTVVGHACLMRKAVNVKTNRAMIDFIDRLVIGV